MKKVVVLGCGLVGSVIAKELACAGDIEVIVVDRSEDRLAKLKEHKNITCIAANLSEEGSVREISKQGEVVVGAVPGYLGFKCVSEAIEAGKDVVDISFSERDYTELDEAARSKGCTVFYDCGVAPGLSNILAYALCKELDEAKTVKIYVGGLPQVRYWPFEYRIVFSPYDVIEEYTRPARVVANHKVLHKEPLSEIELIDVPGIGTLEAFCSDGLRSLIRTLKVGNMEEKTLRYPGHAEKMKILRHIGYFSKEEVDIYGKTVRPIDVTAKLLFPILEMREGEKDVTVLKVEAIGKSGQHTAKIGYFMVDYYDASKKITSMAKTTGFPAVVFVRMLLEGKFKEKGVFPPETVSIRAELLDEFLNRLKQMGVSFSKVNY